MKERKKEPKKEIKYKKIKKENQREKQRKKDMMIHDDDICAQRENNKTTPSTKSKQFFSIPHRLKA